MPTRPLAKSKKGYQAYLWIYLDRKQKLQKKEGRTLRVQKLEHKINSLKRAIKNIDIREDKIKKAAELINDFFGVDVKKIPKRRILNSVAIPRNVFSKYCIEVLSIQSSHISRFLSFYKTSAWRQRRVFTKSFATNKENRKAYHSFIEYLKRIDNEC